MAGAPLAVANYDYDYDALPMDDDDWILLPLPLAADEVKSNPQPHVIIAVGTSDHDGEAAEIRSVDLEGNVIKRWQIRRPIFGSLSMHGDLLCASHGWGLTSVAHMVTGDVTDVAVEPRKKVKAATPLCVLGHIPATGEYKVLRLQADELSRRRRQTCEVMTLGSCDDAGRWRRRTPPPITLNIKPGSSSWNVAVVAGIAYFLVCRGPGDEYDENVKADSIVLFDLAREEWRPSTLQGPLTVSLEAGTDVEDTVPLHHRRRHPPFSMWHSLSSLSKRFQLARLGDSLVVVYCNVEDSSTELWFLDDDTSSPRWSRRYTLQCTPFKEDRALWHNYFSISASVQQYHYPLAVLEDGRILVWVDMASALRAYDPKTSVWTDLATLTGGSSVVGTHQP